MGKKKISESKIDSIVSLREIGYSYPEIQKKTRCGFGTVYRYANEVKVKSEFVQILRDKQGKSKKRSQEEWEKSSIEASSILSNLSRKNKLCILLGIYWGEGSKQELNVINGDPKLLYVFIECLKEFGLKKDDIVVSLRLFSIEKKVECLNYWSQELKIPRATIKIGEIVKGSDSTRLPYGMCRIRVRKGAKYFKLIMSMIKCVPKLM